MKSAYFINVPKHSSGYDGLEILGNNDLESWFVGDYQTVTDRSFVDTKTDIIEWTNKIRRRETNPGDWDWHHIVEGQHAAMLSIKGDLEHQYNNELPVILIHKPEHQFFSRNFNNNQFFELVNATKKKKELLQGEAMAMYAQQNGKDELKIRAANSKKMFQISTSSIPFYKELQSINILVNKIKSCLN